MKLLFKQLGALLGVLKLLAGVTFGGYLQANRAAPEVGSNAGEQLPAGVIESLGNAQERGEAANDSLPAIVQETETAMMRDRGGLAVVVPDEAGNRLAAPSLETGDITVKDQVFAVPVMASMVHCVAHVMQQRTGFEQDPGFASEVMHRLELVEERKTQLADLLGVTLVRLEPPCKAPDGKKQLTVFR